MTMGALEGRGLSGSGANKVRAISLITTVTLETGAMVMTKIQGLVPLLALQATLSDNKGRKVWRSHGNVLETRINCCSVGGLRWTMALL